MRKTYAFARLCALFCLNRMLLELKASHAHRADNTTALIIDIGANIGFFTTYLASEGYDVIAVEPRQEPVFCKNPDENCV